MVKEKKYKVEFHVHTIFSKDSLLSKYLIIFMCKLKKIDCIAITDHNEIEYAKKSVKLLKKHGIEVIVGEEIFTNDGEIIGLYLDKKIEPGLSALDTVREIKKQGGYVYIPHPYDTKRSKTVINYNSLKQIVSYVDFIEIHNGRNLKEEFSEKQNSIAEELSLRKIVGSDAHTFYEIGRNYCVVSSLKKEDLKNEIEKMCFFKKKCLKFSHTNTKFVKLIKIIGKGDFNELYRIINKRCKRKNF